MTKSILTYKKKTDKKPKIAKSVKKKSAMEMFNSQESDVDCMEIEDDEDEDQEEGMTPS